MHTPCTHACTHTHTTQSPFHSTSCYSPDALHEPGVESYSPDALHEPGVESLIVILEIYPSPHPSHDFLQNKQRLESQCPPTTPSPLLQLISHLPRFGVSYEYLPALSHTSPLASPIHTSSPSPPFNSSPHKAHVLTLSPHYPRPHPLPSPPTLWSIS